jgi:hypothetical protein
VLCCEKVSESGRQRKKNVKTPNGRWTSWLDGLIILINQQDNKAYSLAVYMMHCTQQIVKISASAGWRGYSKPHHIAGGGIFVPLRRRF